MAGLGRGCERPGRGGIGTVWIVIAIAASETAITGREGRQSAVWPGGSWLRATPAEVGMDATRLAEARQAALRGGGSGCIVRHGRLALAWGPQHHRYDLKSSTKSIGSMALALALADGKARLGDRAATHHPSFGVPPGGRESAKWRQEVTLFQLATQTAGFEKPGGYTRIFFAPGTRWSYSDGGPNWLAECITLLYRRDIEELMFERVFTPLGISREDLRWRRNAYRPERIDGIARREFGSGVHASVDAMARIGLLWLRRGLWRGKRILPESFVDLARKTPEAIRALPVEKPETYFEASHHYGLLWWNNEDGTIAKLPRDAYWSWGLYDSLIVVIPSLDLVAARAGKSLPGRDGADYARIAPFLVPLARGVTGTGSGAATAAATETETAVELPTAAESTAESATATAVAIAPSAVIRAIRWAPEPTVIRRARGSDNWPVTWCDGGELLAAYGDGWGFEPRVERKLSLGLALVRGSPPHLRPANLRSPSIEQLGDGSRGIKASSLLAVGGRIWLLARNADNSRLARSDDGGVTWRWCSWRFERGFGFPVFLQRGRGYRDAPDGFVYLYSLQAQGAYDPADSIVLARAPAGRLQERAAWRFYAGRRRAGAAEEDAASPRWSARAEDRVPTFADPGRCWRFSVSWNRALRRYLMVSVLPASSRTRRRGLRVLDAPAPEGPWTLAWEAAEWDIDPGECASVPVKWIEPSGGGFWLLFSGEDSFSARHGTFLRGR